MQRGLTKDRYTLQKKLYSSIYYNNYRINYQKGDLIGNFGAKETVYKGLVWDPALSLIKMVFHVVTEPLKDRDQKLITQIVLEELGKIIPCPRKMLVWEI